jgi:ribosome recycling factor
MRHNEEHQRHAKLTDLRSTAQTSVLQTPESGKMINDLFRDTEVRMKDSVSVLKDELAAIRTGRASPALVEKLSVVYYGTPTPLNQLATIAAPEPQLLTIRPFDPGSLGTIEKAIQTSELGLTPSNDGKIIRLAIPPLTEERRREIVKVVHKRVEESKVAIRHIRRDALEDLREFEKEKMISEDDFFRSRDDLQGLTDRYVEQIEELRSRKEQEIMEV